MLARYDRHTLLEPGSAASAIASIFINALSSQSSALFNIATNSSLDNHNLSNIFLVNTASFMSLRVVSLPVLLSYEPSLYSPFLPRVLLAV